MKVNTIKPSHSSPLILQQTASIIDYNYETNPTLKKNNNYGRKTQNRFSLY